MTDLVIQDQTWVSETKRSLTSLYEGHPLKRMPFEFIAYCDIKGKIEEDKIGLKKTTATISQIKNSYYDYELALNNQLNNYKARIDDRFRDDTVGAIFPLAGPQGWFVEFFGARNEWFPNRPPVSRPLITDASQIDSISPDINSGELFRVGMEQMRYFNKHVGEKIPVGTMDLQSPIDYASMLMEYTSLVYLMIDEPSKAHCLLRMITDVLIESLHMMKKEMISDWPLTMFGWWVPRGVFMSDDLMAIMNPELYAEFGKPYNEIIGREFGGVSLHSCGNIKHNLENVANTEGIIALNTHESLETTAEILKNRVVVITGAVKEVIAPNYPGGKRDNLKTGAEVEALWWNDFEQYPQIRNQRNLYQCSALLKDRTAEEAYEKMLNFSLDAVTNKEDC